MAESNPYGPGEKMNADGQQVLSRVQDRWLRPDEICKILRNHKLFAISQKAENMPQSGSLFLFDRNVVRRFRKDGYRWKKAKDGKTVKEGHEKLKVGGVDALHCYYAHGEETQYFHRRSYRMIEQNLTHIVLVHYREVKGTTLEHIKEIGEGVANSQTSKELIPCSAMNSYVSSSSHPNNQNLHSQESQATNMTSLVCPLTSDFSFTESDDEQVQLPTSLGGIGSRAQEYRSQEVNDAGVTYETWKNGFDFPLKEDNFENSAAGNESLLCQLLSSATQFEIMQEDEPFCHSNDSSERLSNFEMSTESFPFRQPSFSATQSETRGSLRVNENEMIWGTDFFDERLVNVENGTLAGIQSLPPEPFSFSAAHWINGRVQQRLESQYGEPVMVLSEQTQEGLAVQTHVSTNAIELETQKRIHQLLSSQPEVERLSQGQKQLMEQIIAKCVNYQVHDYLRFMSNTAASPDLIAMQMTPFPNNHHPSNNSQMQYEPNFSAPQYSMSPGPSMHPLFLNPNNLQMHCEPHFSALQYSMSPGLSMHPPFLNTNNLQMQCEPNFSAPQYSMSPGPSMNPFLSPDNSHYEIEANVSAPQYSMSPLPSSRPPFLPLINMQNEPDFQFTSSHDGPI